MSSKREIGSDPFFSSFLANLAWPGERRQFDLHGRRYRDNTSSNCPLAQGSPERMWLQEFMRRQRIWSEPLEQTPHFF
jgi:hypothetical protein